ncbi:MAG: extracellular solute-binding protein [Clostridia bacterium]|nr:extracellular solute-binding protein [Clostridia bacterium]
MYETYVITSSPGYALNSAANIQELKATPKVTATVSKSPITLTMYSDIHLYNYEDYKSPVAKKLKEKTGVTLKMIFPVGSYKQKVGVMAASGEYPDIMYLSSDSVATFMKINALVPWNNYLEKYGSNIKAFYGDKIKRLQYSKNDKNIYALNGNMGNDARPGYMWDFSFAVQLAVLKEQGYPRLKSLKDFENSIKSIRTNILRLMESLP